MKKIKMIMASLALTLFGASSVMAVPLNFSVDQVKTIDVNIEARSKVLDLKKALKEGSGIPVEEQILMVDGVPTKSDQGFLKDIYGKKLTLSKKK